MYERKAIKERRALLMDQIDKVRLPKDFCTWLHKYVFAATMFFKLTGKKQYTGACQHCKKEDITLTAPKQKKLGRCPACNKPVRFRNIKFKQKFHEKEWVSYVHKIPEGSFVMRTFQLIKFSDFLSWEWQIGEYERGCTKDFKKIEWSQSRMKFSTSHGGWKLHWQGGLYSNGMFGPQVPLMMWTYPNNLKKLLEKTDFKFSQVEKLVRTNPTFIAPYLEIFKEHPQIEYIFKLKMFHLLKDLILEQWRQDGLSDKLFNWSENDIRKCLKLSGKYFNYAIKNNISKDKLKALQFLQRIKSDITKEALNCCQDLSIATTNSVLWNYINLETLVNYAKEQQAKNISYFINDYADYIEACQGLGYNLNDTKYLKPNDFRQAHDQALNLWRQKQDKQLPGKVLEALNSYRNIFKFQDKEYSIIAPKNAKDIEQEGEILDHCVGNYLRRIAAKNSIILFVRKTEDPNKRFYTLEINPQDYSVVQCRGYKNNDHGRKPTPPDILNFIDRALEKIKKRNRLCKYV